MSAPADGFAAEMARAAPRGRVGTMLAVLGDQLSMELPAFAALDRAADAVLMMEVKQESEHAPSHVQRTVLFFSAMRHFAMEAAARGYRVRYVTLDDAGNTQSLTGEVARAAVALRPGRVVVTQPGEYRVEAMLGAWGKSAGVEVEVFEDTSFLTSGAQFAAWARGRRSLTMEYFYREQRRRLGVLVRPDGTPEGGDWNFDAENRESFRSAPGAPVPRRFEPDAVTRGVMEMVRRELPRLPGRMERFGWAVTAADAAAAMDDFVGTRLAGFGPCEDAMWTGEPWLYHAQMSPAMNLKLISPRAMLDRVIGAWERGGAPLQSVEGFVRQIIGWREFIRGVYWYEGAGYAERNGLGHTGNLPEFYWTGRTDMNCLRHSVDQVLEHAYGHHIQRLMVTGNFALIAGVHPKKVSDWYLGMFADGVDWVTLPNTLGMSQHADGGVVGTKPYAASANYIGKMSNYCKGCRYDAKKRTGEDACPFNTLYWDFLLRHRERFGANQRMAMVMKNVQRLSGPEVTEITVGGRKIRERLGV